MEWLVCRFAGGQSTDRPTDRHIHTLTHTHAHIDARGVCMNEQPTSGRQTRPMGANPYGLWHDSYATSTRNQFSRSVCVCL